MSELSTVQRAYADLLAVGCGLTNARLIEALASVPRERFLPPGPWRVRGDANVYERGVTPDADPRHVYQNVSIAIDAERQLFNGAPGVVCTWIEALEISQGARVLHVGCGLGYYAALLAYCVGPTGAVVAIEVEGHLARQAEQNLEPFEWAEVRHGSGDDLRGERFDAILVHAGVTHPQRQWLDALGDCGRLVLPLTCTFPQMGPLGKGYALLISSRGDGRAFDARVLDMVVIYSAVGLREPLVNERLGQALMRDPRPAIRCLRLDGHDPLPECWLHTDLYCLSRA
jgi:protein-L-isoaspartate(D-aspartate) O-methyltransferase